MSELFKSFILIIIGEQILLHSLTYLFLFLFVYLCIFKHALFTFCNVIMLQMIKCTPVVTIHVVATHCLTFVNDKSQRRGGAGVHIIVSKKKKIPCLTAVGTKT